MLSLVLAVLLFLLLSGLMAMVDAAVLSVSRAEVEEMVLNGEWGARRLRTVKLHIARAVVVIVIVTNTINVLGPILVGLLAEETYGAAAVGVVTAVLVVGTIVFSEIIPKSIGSHHAPLVSRFSAPPVLAAGLVLFPLVWLLERVVQLLETGERRVGTEEQIRSLATLGRRAGYIERDEGGLVHRAFLLNDVTAEQIHTPLERVEWLSAELEVGAAAQRLLELPYSRYPVFGESTDRVQGFVTVRDVFSAELRGQGQASVGDVAFPPLIVQADTLANSLLVKFRQARVHLAVVQRDEKTIGIVTLEDVLEELVGEIEDETDAAALRESQS